MLVFVAHCVVNKVNLLWRELPFLQEADSILQGFILLLQLLVAIVKHLKPLSISAGNKCNYRSLIETRLNFVHKSEARLKNDQRYYDHHIYKR